MQLMDARRQPLRRPDYVSPYMPCNDRGPLIRSGGPPLGDRRRSIRPAVCAIALFAYARVCCVLPIVRQKFADERCVCWMAWWRFYGFQERFSVRRAENAIRVLRLEVIVYIEEFFWIIFFLVYVEVFICIFYCVYKMEMRMLNGKL